MALRDRSDDYPAKIPPLPRPAQTISLPPGRQPTGPGLELTLSHFHGRKGLRDRAFLEGAPRGVGRDARSFRAMRQRGRGIRQRLLGLVDLGALQRRELLDLAERQDREQLEKFPDVGVLDIAPILPEVIRAAFLSVEPDRALRGLAHLGSR